MCPHIGSLNLCGAYLQRFTSFPVFLLVLRVPRPTNGLKLKSQPEVLRYLNSSGKCQTPIKIKQENAKKVGEKKTVADLPAAWIKEFRTTRKRGHKARRDPHNIHPVGGHSFRSIPGDMHHLHSKLGKIKKLKDEVHSSAKAKPQASRNKKNYRNLSNIMKSGKRVADRVTRSQEKIMNVEDDEQLEKNGDDISLECDLSNNLQFSLNGVKQEVDNLQVMKVVRNRLDVSAILDRRLKSGSKAADLKTADFIYVKRRSIEKEPMHANLPDKQPEVNEEKDQRYGRRRSRRLHEGNLKQHQSIHSENDDAKESSQILPEIESHLGGEGNELSNLKREKRSRGKCFANESFFGNPKRLAVLMVSSSVEPQSSKEARGDKGKADEEGIGSRPGSSYEPGISDRRNPSAERNGNPSDHEMGGSDVVGDVPFPEGDRNVVDATPSRSEKQEISSSSPSVLKDLLMDPCIEFAVKTLTGAITIEDVRNIESSLILAYPSACSSRSMTPSGDIWSDPCFEFAVKTLTGELPMECGSKPQASFHQSMLSPRITRCSSGINNVSSSNHS